MSNCLDLRNVAVKFTSDEIDLATLAEMVEKSIPEDADKWDDAKKYLTQWFLADCTDISKWREGIITIRFGYGRSTHTFRDFRGTINYLIKPLMKKSKVHTFIARDAENPELGWFDWTIDFQKGVET